ncbi:unnamed protein product [Larinioides sclopetarius]
MNILRKIAETYIKNVVSTSFVCENIYRFMQLFCVEDIWHKTLCYFKRREDKFLLYGIKKFLAATMYTFTQELFVSRLEILLKDLHQNAKKESCSYDLELLKCLVDFCSSRYIDSNICSCENPINCTVLPLEDIFTVLCLELSYGWNTLLDIFLRVENQNLSLFLNLWKHLCERNLKEEFLLIFLNDEFAVDFLSLSLKMPSEPFRMYVDIISQIFSSNSKRSVLKHLEEKKFEEAVINALSAELFQLLSSRSETSPFCSSVSRCSNLLGEETIKFAVTSKKVIFIILNLLAEFRNILLLCKGLKEVFNFFAKHIKNRKSQSTYLWIIDTFIEEDDLLFGVMLASLRIYCSLKNLSLRSESNTPAVDVFMKEMDPHKIFIKFLQQIGNDHNELLSFLLSDETCFLLYLMQYLKLFLKEWKSFIEAHRILKNSENITAFSSEENSSEQFHIPGSSKLVSYSSSSSSDEECADAIGSTATDDLKCLEELAFGTVSVLIKLKVAIQKLVDMNEFPYNISPMISLLEICEKESHTLR